MKIRLSPQQVQKTVLAPHMQQSIEVLLLPILELNTAIDQELQNNPLLEVDEEKNTIDKEQLDEIINQSIKTFEDSPRLPQTDYLDQEMHEERPISRTAPLEDYLLQQLRLEITDSLELKIGELIIGNLDEDGYFNSTCEEVAQILNISDVAIVEKTLIKIQNFDPIGIASRNLKECLLTQVNSSHNGNAELLARVIDQYLDLVGRKKYAEIARKLKVSEEKIKEIAHTISTLECKPARNFRPIDSSIYVKPDVFIVKDANGDLSVQINRDNVPSLRISAFYQKMLKEPKRTLEEKTFIQEKIKNALLFIKSVEQRSQTIEQIAQYILDHQKDFFEQGYMALRPMKLKDVAEAINRNESTICRAVNKKYVDTPQGLYLMKFFFSQAISDNSDETVCSRSIKEEIRALIDEEDKSRPLSDQEIQKYFEEKGMQLARRTISKYRQSLKILPSHLRKS